MRELPASFLKHQSLCVVTIDPAAGRIACRLLFRLF